MSSLHRPLYIHVLVFIGILSLCFLFYGNSLKNQYNLDDNYVIVDQPLTNQGVKAIPKIFRSHYVNAENEKHSYRPITLVTFAVEYELFGANPLVSHIISVLLYSLCCFLVFRLVLYLKPKDNNYLLSLVAAFLFLIVPVHSEVVNNVKCRDELLCFIFILVSCLYFLKFGRLKSYKYLFLGVLFFLLSLLSKLSSLTFVAIIPTLLYFFTPIKKKRLLSLFGILFGVFILISVFKRLLIENKSVARELEYFENPLFDGTKYFFFDRIPAAISTFGSYVQLLIYPNKLISYYGYNQVAIATWGEYKVWLVLFMIVGIILCIIWFWKKNPMVAFGLLWFCIGISMFTNLVKPVVGIIAERFVFLPSVGFAIVIGCVLMSILKMRKFLFKSFPKVLAGLLVLIFATLNFYRIQERNKDWYDFDTLLRNDIKIAPNSAKLHALLANKIFRDIRKEELGTKRTQLVAETKLLYKRCLEIYPGYATSWNNWGTLIVNEHQDFTKALTYYQNAITYKKNYKDALYGAGYANEMLGNTTEAFKYYDKLLVLDPNYRDVKDRWQSLRVF